MKLNLHILADKLTHYNPNIKSQNLIAKNLINVSLLPDNLAMADEGYVYITKAENLKQHNNLNEIALIIIGEPNSGFLSANCQEYILITQNINEISLMREVQSIFDYYERFESRFMISILTKEPVQNLLDICAELLESPIILFDTSYILVSYACITQYGIYDSMWENTLRYGYSRIEDVPIGYRRITEECLKAGIPIIHPPLSEPSDKRMMSATLVRDGIHFATISVTELKNKFTFAHLSLMEYIQRCLEYSSQIPDNLVSNINGTSYVLTQLINGVPIEENLLDYYLKKQHWDKFDNIYLLVAYPTDGKPLNNVYRGAHLINIKQAIPESYVLFVNDTLVIIYRCISNTLGQEEIFDQLKHLLMKLRWIAGISMLFTGYNYLNIATQQAKAALDYGRKTSDGQVFFSFSEVYKSCLINSLGSRDDALKFCHPKILSILIEENPWELELIETLSTYLKNGRNISTTSSILHIHRNTLTNRLKNIEAMLGITLDNISSVDLDILLASCMICNQFSPVY